MLTSTLLAIALLAPPAPASPSIPSRGDSVPAPATAASASPSRAAADTTDTVARPKPLVRRGGSSTIIGGYISLEYHNMIDRHTSVIDQHRLVPFISAQIAPSLHFSTEIEFEHATRIENAHGAAEGAGAVEVEYAHLDYTLTHWLTARGGVILDPLGSFNLSHDDPLNELTMRPLVSLLVIPSVLREPGFGFTGSVSPRSGSYVSYEAYLVNGFTQGILTPDGLRTAEGVAASEQDNNFAKSLVGRLAYSPIPGLELGASGHTGVYSSAGAGFTGHERLTITALDATYRTTLIGLMGEYAQARADLPTSGPYASIANRQSGYYVEGSYRAPVRRTVDGPAFLTGVVRWDHVNLADGRTGDVHDRLSIGGNWRPVPQTAFKLSFDWEWTTPPGSTQRSAADRALRASVASYF